MKNKGDPKHKPHQPPSDATHGRTRVSNVERWSITDDHRRALVEHRSSNDDHQRAMYSNVEHYFGQAPVEHRPAPVERRSTTGRAKSNKVEQHWAVQQDHTKHKHRTKSAQTRLGEHLNKTVINHIINSRISAAPENFQKQHDLNV